MEEKDLVEVRRIQAAIAPRLLAQVIEEFCNRAGVDKDQWFGTFSSRYLSPLAKMKDNGRFATLSRKAAEYLVRDTVRALHPNIRH